MIQSNGDVRMRRISQSEPFQLNHFAERLPIHYRQGNSLGVTQLAQGKKIIVPATAFAHDLTHTETLNGGADNSVHPFARSSSVSPKSHKAPVFLPGDRVIFAESPSAPGIPVVYRTPEERASNPDRLNLDRRRLTVCPVLEGEDNLKLLNYQHNLITRIQHLSSLRRLIFLDLYDNQIEEISGLNSLKCLRVLMLGNNRIKKIENLDSLLKLDVLDLHGNQITMIEKLNHLAELRVLNLAGNLITHVNGLTGMDSLAELNLRRNKIKCVTEVDNLPCIMRLFLSFNDIVSFEDISCVGECSTLSELSLDGNPLTQESHYKQSVLRHMQQLKQLDMKRITEEERRIAIVMARKEEEKKREINKMAIVKEKRRLAINNAKRQWEVMQGSLIHHTGKLGKMPDLYANHVGTFSTADVIRHTRSETLEDKDEVSSVSDLASRPQSSTSVRSAPTEPYGDGTRSRPGSRGKGDKPSLTPLKETMTFAAPGSKGGNSEMSHLADLEADKLSIYGPGAMEALDKNWGIHAAGAVTTITFKFIDFDVISKHLHKIRTRFPSVHTLVFSATNIRCLQQLNALSNVRRLENLTIDVEGNPVTKFTHWRIYTLFRLAHFNLKKINDIEVSSSDIAQAERLFGSLSHLTTSQLPPSRLLSLLGESRRKQIMALYEDKSRRSEVKTTERPPGEFVGRSGLGYTPPVADTKTSQSSHADVAKSYVAEVVKDTLYCDRKNNELRRIWPQLFYEMVKDAVLEMTDIKSYMKKCMEEIERS
ncbi:leucine-rich repeat-containing protein 49-like isoform X2 [Liolophura sinensis]